MFALRPGLVSACVAVAVMTSGTARACGGFFCDNVNPVLQTAERILFRVNDDDTVTAIVEIQFAGPPAQFGWVLPIGPELTAEDLGTAPAGLFDELEQRMAPVFERPPIEDGAGLDDQGGGCNRGRYEVSRGGGGGSDTEPPPPDTSGVNLVGEAVIGPYDLQIITAEQGQNLINWLLMNGYQVGPSAIPAIDYYIDRKMAFLGIKLEADVPAGPIDALSFTYPGDLPSIPLILTSVAAAQDMELTVYVAGPGRFVPGNYADMEFDYDSVSWIGQEETDYPMTLATAVDVAGGRAFNTEYANRIVTSGEIGDTPLAPVLEPDDYVTRYHTFISPEDMTADPYWVPGPSAGDVDNRHVLADEAGFDAEVRRERGPEGLAALLMVPVLWIGRRRRAATGRRRGRRAIRRR